MHWSARTHQETQHKKRIFPITSRSINRGDRLTCTPWFVIVLGLALLGTPRRSRRLGDVAGRQHSCTPPAHPGLPSTPGSVARLHIRYPHILPPPTCEHSLSRTFCSPPQFPLAEAVNTRAMGGAATEPPSVSLSCTKIHYSLYLTHTDIYSRQQFLGQR